MPSEASQIELDNTKTHIISDVDAYLEAPAVSMDTNPLNFWNKNSKKYPLLAILAKEVLAIPASSSPVERLFSIAGKIFRPERCQLSSVVLVMTFNFSLVTDSFFYQKELF